MQPKFFWGSCVTTAAFLFFTNPALADIGFKQVSIGQSQGLGGKDVPTLEISPLWGLTISFIKTNELVQQARISDPARVLVDFDSPLAGGSESRTLQTGAPGRSPGGAAVTQHIGRKVATLLLRAIDWFYQKW